MFRDREGRLLEKLSAEIGPYRAIASDLEAEDRLVKIDADLNLRDRHLLTSNDRYQMSAAYLALVRNRTILASTIADRYLNKDSGPDLRREGFTFDPLSKFLVGAYTTAKDGIETADLVTATVGFSANDTAKRDLIRTGTTIDWPRAGEISRHFVAGGVAAVDTILAYTVYHFHLAMQSARLPNDFKFHLSSRVEPLLTRAENQRAAIDRVTGGEISTSLTSFELIAELYADIRDAVAALDEASLWITMPALYESTFVLREPLAEGQHGKRPFRPGSVLGKAATQTVVQPPQRRPRSQSVTPPVSARPFDPATVNKPPAKPQRPFDPATVDPPTRPERPFDPSTVQPSDKKRQRRNPRPFDPSILDQDNQEQ